MVVQTVIVSSEASFSQHCIRNGFTFEQSSSQALRCLCRQLGYMDVSESRSFLVCARHSGFRIPIAALEEPVLNHLSLSNVTPRIQQS